MSECTCGVHDPAGTCEYCMARMRGEVLYETSHEFGGCMIRARATVHGMISVKVSGPPDSLTRLDPEIVAQVFSDAKVGWGQELSKKIAFCGSLLLANGTTMAKHVAPEIAEGRLPKQLPGFTG